MLAFDLENDPIVKQAAAQMEATYRQLYPNVAHVLDMLYNLTEDPDGTTWWLRGPSEAEPFGSKDAAEEARRTRVLHGLAQHHLTIAESQT